MPLFTDTEGKWQVPGLKGRTLRTSFLDGVLPAWLTPSGGSAPTFASGDGRLVLSTTATINTSAAIYTPSFNSAGLKAIRYDLEGLSFSSSNIDVEVSWSGTASGGMFMRQLVTDAYPILSSGGVSYTVPNHNIIADGTGAMRRDLSLLVLPATKEGYILHGDEIKGYRKFAGFNGGSFGCGIKITTKAASIATASIGTIGVTVWA